MKLTQDWMERLGEALKVTPQELISDPPLKRTVYVDGSVELDGAVDMNIDEEETTALEYEVDLGTTAPDASRWFFTEADMFPPAIQNGDLLRFTFIQNKSYEKYIGRICMIYFKENIRPIVGILSRGTSPATFNVTRPDGRLVRNVEPDYITVLTMSVAFPKYTEDEDGYPVLSQSS